MEAGSEAALRLNKESSTAEGDIVQKERTRLQALAFQSQYVTKIHEAIPLFISLVQ